MLDYFFGLAMLSAPAFGQFSEHNLPTAIFVILGVLIIVYSIFTQYEHGPYGVLPVKLNLKFDMAIGAFVIASPFLFGLGGYVMWIILGGMMITTALISETEAPGLAHGKKMRPLKAVQKHDIYKLYGRSRAGRR